MQPESANQQTKPPQSNGFGKVLGSLHGLQQRLDNFSIEDVSNADTNIKTLIQQISFIQGRLTILGELKQSITTINDVIESIPEQNFDIVSPDGLENHPQLHAIVQAGKLIRFFRLMQAARDSADTISLESETGVTMLSAGDHRRYGAEDRKEDIGVVQGQNSNEAIRVEDKCDTSNIIQAEVISAPPSAAILSMELLLGSQEQARSAVEVTAFITDEAVFENATTTAGVGNAATKTPAVDSPSQLHEIERSTNAANLSTQAAETNIMTNVAEFPKSLEPATKSLPLIETNQTNESDNSINQLGSAKNRSNKKRSAEKSPTHTSDTKVPTTLDKRLLDDLIKQYGDFTVTPNLPAPIETPKKNRSKPTTVTDPNPPEFDGPIFENSITEKKSIGQVQKAGELDRQLKKIIKDYGEYDLYPRQNTLNLKTAGIVAFAVLGLVLGGIYFFKSPNLTKTPQSQTESSAPASASKGGQSESAKEDKATSQTVSKITK